MTLDAIILVGIVGGAVIGQPVYEFLRLAVRGVEGGGAE